jgi:bacteriorhodopsin
MIIGQVFWTHYLEVLFGSPLILLILAFLAGLPSANVVTLMVAELVCVGTGWLAVGAMSEKQRVGYLVFSVLGNLTILYILVFPCRRAALARSAGVGKLFTSLAVYTLIVRLCYFMYVSPFPSPPGPALPHHAHTHARMHYPPPATKIVSQP